MSLAITIRRLSLKLAHASRAGAYNTNDRDGGRRRQIPKLGRGAGLNGMQDGDRADGIRRVAL